MWDGRHDALYNQVFGALENPVEMNSSRLFAAEQIYQHYRTTYEAIFGPMPSRSTTRLVSRSSTARPPVRQAVADDTGALRTGSRCHGMPGDNAEFDGLSAEDDGTR